MKRCIDCHSNHESSLCKCPNCDFTPISINGFEAYAPKLAHDGGGFKENYFSELAALEDTNFWFRSRNQLILWAIERYCPNFRSFLEIGCGTGYVLSGVAKKFPNRKLSGSEIFVAGLSFAAERLPHTEFMQMDARNIPFKGEFDVIGAFDVLEHIKEDEEVLAQMYTALNPKGLMLLTVPQHTWLWSATDDHACHVRRYTKKDLHQKIKAAGFEVIKSTSFIAMLLPAMIISRFCQKKTSNKKIDATAELRISPWLNAFFYQILRCELVMIKQGVNFRLGGSRLVVAQKI